MGQPIRVAAVAVLLSFAGGSVWAQYALTDLGVLPGCTSSAPRGLNAHGQVVGYCTTASGTYQAFLDSGGTMTPLGTLAGYDGSVGYSINSSGQVVGYSYTASGTFQGFLYSSGTMTPIGPGPGGIVDGLPYGISDNGQIVGQFNNSQGYGQAFLFDGANWNNLGSNPPNDNSVAFGVNNSGVVTGWSLPGNSYDTAMVYSNGTMTDIFPNGSGGYIGSQGYGINASGEVTGYEGQTSGGNDAFVYDNGTVAYLGTLGGASSIGRGIADSGQVVGQSQTASGDEHAFLYNGSMTDLNALISPSLGWTLTYAYAVNAAGQIAGVGTNASGQTDALLLTPQIPGDANLDGTVDINDLTVVLSNYGARGATWWQGDFNGDGKVDINDLTIVLSHYGQSVAAPGGGPTAVPEPGTLIALAAGLAGLLVCVWRQRK